jgi:hypothetical protein
MKTATLTLTALTLVSAMGFAKPLAKMLVVCVANDKQDTIRTVYATADKSFLLADPLSSLLMVDSLTQPTNDSVLISATTEVGSETLTVNESGEASLVVVDKSSNNTYAMKCYGNGAILGLVFN